MSMAESSFFDVRLVYDGLGNWVIDASSDAFDHRSIAPSHHRRCAWRSARRTDEHDDRWIRSPSRFGIAELSIFHLATCAAIATAAPRDGAARTRNSRHTRDRVGRSGRMRVLADPIHECRHHQFRRARAILKLHLEDCSCIVLA